MIKIPTKFVGLHGHSGFSIHDGLSEPSLIHKSILENEMDATAITDHGNMNGFVASWLSQKDLNKKEPKTFKALYGIEFYFHPSLKEWKMEYDLSKENKAKQKKSDEAKTAVVENEEETKSNKYFNPLRRRHHLVALAKTSKGLQNLFCLVSKSYKDGFYHYPRIDFDLLKEFGEDIILSSACLGGPLGYPIFGKFEGKNFDELTPSIYDNSAQTIKDSIILECENLIDRFIDAVGIENFNLELQFNKIPAQHLLNKVLVELHKKTKANIVVTTDFHYPKREMWRHRELYKKLGWLNFNNLEFGKLPNSVDELKAELYPKNASQLWESYKETTKQYDFYEDNIVYDAIERTYDIAHQQIGKVEPDTSVKLPSWVVPEGKTAFNKLVELCKEGLIKRKLHNKKEYVDRLKEELEVIKEKNFCEYFLMTQEITALAREKVLVNFGRGSGAGSLVCYVLWITNIDPIKYGLLFSRFINKYRSGLPDIDQDFSDREVVVNLLKEKYGEESVINISNYNAFKLKSLVKDISRFYEIEFEEVNEATKYILSDVIQGSRAETGEKNINPTFKDALKYCKKFKDFIDKYPQVAESIDVLFKQNKSIGTHAGGVIIADNILDRMPVIVSKKKLQTPWCESGLITHLEHVGWIKFDLLGVETLAVIERAIELILKRREGIKNPSFEQIRDWFEKTLDPNVLNLEDQKVYEHVYHNGNFLYTFQFTEEPVQKFCLKSKPTNITDIATITSIFRPGPLKADVDKLYVDAKNNPDKIDYKHPLIKQVLENTYSMLVFQEQAMAIANVVAGFPLDQTDNFRRLISKKPEKGSEMEKSLLAEKDRFIDGCVKNGVNKTTASDLFDKIMFFSGYGFNKCLYERTTVETQTNGIKSIKDVKKGEYVFSKNGFVKIKDVIYNGKRLIHVFKTSLGKELICTLDHKIETVEYGLIRIQDVFERNLDIIVCENGSVGTDRITSCITFGYADTYDLEVDHPDHSFFANDISVSNSHGISYASLSYITAYLFTYYEKEWICAFVENESGVPEKKERALLEIKKYGYEVIKPDINIASDKWEIVENQNKFAQAITSIKGIGAKAFEEINLYRPYSSIENFLWDEEKEWRHSKLNIRLIGNLIKTEAFSSMDIVGPGKLFKNYRQMYEVIVENKKKLVLKKGKENFYRLIEETKDIEDWTNEEKLEFQKDLLGEMNLSILLTADSIKDLKDKGVLSIDEFENNDIYWFIIKDGKIRDTKTGKKYESLEVVGEKGLVYKLNLWDYNINKHVPLKEKNICVAAIEKNDYGFSAKRNRLQILD